MLRVQGGSWFSTVGRLFHFLLFLPMDSPTQISVNGVPYLVDSLGCQLRPSDNPLRTIPIPHHKMQEIPYDAEASTYRFIPSAAKPFLSTPAASREYGPAVICGCLAILKQLAEQHDGLDYLQVFEDRTGEKSEPLWFIEDGDGGAITALLPSDY